MVDNLCSAHFAQLYLSVLVMMGWQRIGKFLLSFSHILFVSVTFRRVDWPGRIDFQAKHFKINILSKCYLKIEIDTCFKKVY